MAYIPSLNDLPAQGYVPSINDLPVQSGSASQNLLNQIQQSQKSTVGRTIMPHEEFSNPSQFPGFSQLPKQEQLNRLSLSQFDPNNQTMTGGFVPPGTYEQPANRMLLSALPSAIQPELGIGGKILSPAINALARIGTGTASNLAYQSPDINNLQNLQNAVKGDVSLNSLLEAGAAPIRAASSMAEVFNPINYTAKKAQQIQNEAKNVGAQVEQKYAPVMNKYAQSPVVPENMKPEDYLENMGINREDLYPDAKLTYDKFTQNQDFQSLHDLQSKIGSDWARISKSPATEEKAQLFNQMRSNIKDNINDFLSKDPNALAQYKSASDFARDNYYPYMANKTLSNIVDNSNMDVSPAQLTNAIDKGTKKVVSKRDDQNVMAIPEDHPLRNHLADLQSRINMGKAAQFAVPTAMGAIGGELLHPGVIGPILGAGAGAAGKLLTPGLTDFIQNPFVRNAISNVNPFYYGAGRAGINALVNPQA